MIDKTQYEKVTEIYLAERDRMLAMDPASLQIFFDLQGLPLPPNEILAAIIYDFQEEVAATRKLRDIFNKVVCIALAAICPLFNLVYVIRGQDPEENADFREKILELLADEWELHPAKRMAGVTLAHTIVSTDDVGKICYYIAKQDIPDTEDGEIRICLEFLLNKLLGSFILVPLEGPRGDPSPKFQAFVKRVRKEISKNLH